MESIARTNLAMADVVIQGILLDTKNGAAFAWAYMAARTVPQQVILRVLSDPSRRRPSDANTLWRLLTPRQQKYIRHISTPAIYRSDYSTDRFNDD